MLDLWDKRLRPQEVIDIYIHVFSPHVQSEDEWMSSDEDESEDLEGSDCDDPEDNEHSKTSSFENLDFASGG